MSQVPEEVIRRFAHKHGTSISESKKLFDELEVFLDEAADSLASPSPAVDEAWHEFILHTKLYGNYCQDRFGYFVHHVPLSPLAAGEGPKDEGKGTKKCCGTGLESGEPLSMVAHKCSSDCRGGGGCRRGYSGEEASV